MCAPGEGVAVWPAPDWSQPWFEPVAVHGAAVRQACEAGVGLPQALTKRAVGLSVPRFIPQAELPAGVAYEAHIFNTGAVPTREGLHDFFNGLC